MNYQGPTNYPNDCRLPKVNSATTDNPPTGVTQPDSFTDDLQQYGELSMGNGAKVSITNTPEPYRELNIKIA